MLRRILVVSLLLVAPALADTTVLHVANHCSPWRGGYNASPADAWMTNWPNANSDGVLAEFDRTELQNAISSQITASGGWNAKVIVTQVEWINTAIPANLAPIVASVDVDPSTLAWLSSTYYTAGNGNWSFGGASYPNFVDAVNAGVTAGKSYIAGNPAWQGVWKPANQSPMSGVDYWDIVIDVPEYLLVHYLNNPAADGLFVGAKITGGYVDIYGNDQWGRTADIRVLIAAPPTTAPWLNASVLSASRTIALTTPTTSVPVTVTNAGSGSLNWTASESPNVGWISLGSPSGTAGGIFNINIDVTGLAVGTYTTNIVVTDAAAGNGSLTIPVTASVVAGAQPILQLTPTSLTFTAKPTDVTIPSPQSITVKNTGLGALAWTAAESPDVPWMSLVFTTGTDNGQFTVSVNHRGLPTGTYTSTVLVSDPAAQNSPQSLTVTLQIRDQDADITKANSYDNAYEDGANGWIAEMWHMRLNAAGKTAGFVTLCGDSITYANPFGQWPRYGSGKSTADTTICNWMNAPNWGSGTNTSSNGWYLAGWDVPDRNGSFTARSGITAGQYLLGQTVLPSFDAMFTAGFPNPDGKQYRDALMCVILLGTNDLGGGNTPALTSNLTAMIDKLQASKIIPILTTLPPRVGSDANVSTFNTAIRNLAQTRKVPLIDFYAEILRRRPGTTWQNTLISSDGVHPSSSYGGSSASSDPYAGSGLALSNSGYLLRSWLTTQKIAEVKAKVLDRLTGDTDGDTHCDVVDLLTFAATWTLNQGDPAYDQRCDFNGDNTIDIIDLLTLAQYFGTY